MTLKKMLTFFALVGCLFCFGQKNPNASGSLSPIFDISPDNKNIAVAIANGEVSNLYIFSIAENKLTQLTDGKVYFSRPVYSPKGDKIIFLSKSLGAETSDLCAIDLSSKKITKLTDGKTYVTEATFLPNGNEIFYCGAGIITNYSPLARKAPHDIDLYSIETNGANSKKLTSFSAYEFSSISSNQTGDTVLCQLIVKGVQGIYLISLKDTVKVKIEASNNPRPEIGKSFYGSPTYSKDNKKISFIAPYQLYQLDILNKKCEELWSSFGNEAQAMPIFSRFFAEDKKLIFSVLPIVNRQYTKNAQIYILDLTTKKASPIAITN